MAFLRPWEEERKVMERLEYERGEIERRQYEMMQMQQLQMQNANPFAQSLIGGIGRIVPVADPPALDKKLLDSLKKAEPRKVTKRIADSVSMMTGWRAWGVVNEGHEWRLKALGKNHIWHPKKRFEAKCDANNQHPAPQKNCTCGVWSFKTLELLTPALKPYTVTILGMVSLWGRVIETENGFRAQFAYPKELWLLDESMEELGYIYGVPIRTAATKSKDGG